MEQLRQRGINYAKQPLEKGGLSSARKAALVPAPHQQKGSCNFSPLQHYWGIFPVRYGERVEVLRC